MLSSGDSVHKVPLTLEGGVARVMKNLLDQVGAMRTHPLMHPVEIVPCLPGLAKPVGNVLHRQSGIALAPSDLAAAGMHRPFCIVHVCAVPTLVALVISVTETEPRGIM